MIVKASVELDPTKPWHHTSCETHGNKKIVAGACPTGSFEVASLCKPQRASAGELHAQSKAKAAAGDCVGPSRHVSAQKLQLREKT